ncbi:flagellar hook-length control protein FliK [Rosettibacter firmus]|uniref:flagellar hook-length control protein FliK n=1 Tax=Rosettibacter firmus TaxID=3111522 RepID=UPI00336C2BC1
MMNLNPLFFDKLFFVDNKNSKSLTESSVKNYLFSDIIKFCEEELKTEQTANSPFDKEILLDINDLENLIITKSNKETVEGIQQAIELLENISLVSNTNSVNLNSAKITSKVFVIDSDSLSLFFDKINESLQEHNLSTNSQSENPKLIFLNKKEDQKKEDKYSFAGFNPSEIIKSIDNKNLFSITLKTDGEKLALSISNLGTENKLQSKVETQESLDNNTFSPSELSNSENINNKNIDNEVSGKKSTNKLDELISNNETDKNENYLFDIKKLEEVSDEKYYKIEVIHTSYDNNYFIYQPKEETINNNNVEVDSKIAGVINPVKIERQENEILQNSNSINNQKLNNNLNQTDQNLIENKFIKTPETVKPQLNYESADEFTKGELINFNQLVGGKFVKANVIKDTKDKVVIPFESNENRETEKSSNVSNELKSEVENKLNELNLIDFKVEKTVKKNPFEEKIITDELHKSTKSLQASVEAGKNENAEQLPAQNILQSLSKPDLKNALNNYKQNSSAVEKITPANLTEPSEKKKETTKQVQQDSIEIKIEPEKIDFTKATVSQKNEFFAGEFTESKNFNQNSNEHEKNEKKITAKSDLNEFEKAINTEQSFSKVILKHEQVNSQHNLNQKVETGELQSQYIKDKVQSEFNNLKESLKIINADQVVKELASYINSGDKQSITFQLNPESLGKLTLSIDFIENQLHARFEVENEQAKQLIQNNIEQLKNSLQSSGIQLNDVNVSLGSYEQKSLRNAYAKKKSYSKSYGKEIKVENTKTSSTKKMMGYNTYDYLI